MNSRMEKYFEDLHLAEFGDDDNGIQEDRQAFIKLLRRAMNWKSLENIQMVCEYLGFEDDDRIETLEGAKTMIAETIEIEMK